MTRRLSILLLLLIGFFVLTETLIFSDSFQRRNDDDDDDSTSDEGVCEFNEEVERVCPMIPFSKQTMQLGKRPKFLGILFCESERFTFDKTDGSFISRTPGAINVTTCYEPSIGGYQIIATFMGIVVSIIDEYGVDDKCATCWFQDDPGLGGATLYFQAQTQIGNVQTPVGLVESTGKVRVVQNTIPTNDAMGLPLREVVIRTTIDPDTGNLVEIISLNCDVDPDFCD